MLHVAPEPPLERALKKLPNLRYLTADLYNSTAMVVMDITNIHYPDHSFDVIYCSHVLEHVPDDRKAIQEFYRVLSPKGYAVFLVPITAEKTFEDPTITDPAERERLFGQDDHVRRYGPDFMDRLKEGGFDAQDISARDLVGPDQLKRQGVLESESIFFCRKG